VSQQDREIAGLKLQIKALQKALGMLISWLPQSANAPIRLDEASRLINILHGHDE
jgi:hypothetical protein